MSKGEVMILAKFSLLRTLLLAIPLLLCCLPLLWGAVTEGPIGMLKNNKELAVYIVGGWIGMPFTLWLALSLLFQLVFRRAAAVWIEDGTLIYLNKRFFRVARKDVKSIDVQPSESYSFIKLVTVHLSDGKIKRIGTACLRESREELIAKLQISLFPTRNPALSDYSA